MGYYNSIEELPTIGAYERAEKSRLKAMAARDPKIFAINAARNAMQHLRDAEAHARTEWDNLNRPVASPLPAAIHPDLAALLREWLAHQGISDPLAPIHNPDGLAAFIEKRVTEAEADNATAQARVAQIERDHAREELERAQAAMAAVIATYGEDPVAETDSPVEPEMAETPRRRGRPPKTLSPVQVVIEPDADVVPD